MNEYERYALFRGLRESFLSKMMHVANSAAIDVSRRGGHGYLSFTFQLKVKKEVIAQNVNGQIVVHGPYNIQH